MPTKSLANVGEELPTLFDNFFKPWNEWFDGKGLSQRTWTIPAVNVTDEKDHYTVTLAAPGLAKENFSVDVEGNLLTISAEQKEEKEEKEKKFTRKEYNYSSFSRSFNLPDEVLKDKIDAEYTNGILTISIPKNESNKNAASKSVQIK